MKLQRYDIACFQDDVTPHHTGEWVKWNDVSKLEWSHKELLNQLEYMAGQHRCGCEHPHCNRCEDDRMNQEIINKVKGTK